MAEKEIIMLPMSDGVRLETTLSFPDGEGPFPTILMRSCYPDHVPLLPGLFGSYNGAGFGFVFQWCRGIAPSEGTWTPNVNERQDGLDTMNWLAEHPKVKSLGYVGDSYLALTGWCMADAVPDKVKTMVLGVYGCDRHTSAYQDGMFHQDVLTAWAMGNAGKKVEADLMESFLYRPQIEVDQALWDADLPWYRDWISHTDRADPYWQEGFWGMLREIPGKVRFPILMREGWYDHHLGSALRTYELLSAEAKRTSVFEIGPWNHAYRNVIMHQDTDHASFDQDEALKWFKKVLIDEEAPQGEIREYRIGADDWITKSPDAKPGGEKCFYLTAGQTRIDGTLAENPGTDGSVSYVYDPENPCPSHGSESLFAHMQGNGSLEQPAPGYREDVLSFVSEPLSEEFTTDGAITVWLFVSSDAEDTAFSAKVMEIFPDGTTVNVRGGLSTLSYRGASDRRQSYTPGEVVEVPVRMWNIAWKFQKGSRIRVDVSSSDFPQFSVHSNYPGIWSEIIETKPAKQQIYTGIRYKSRVEFPI